MLLKAQSDNDGYCIHMISHKNTVVTVHFPNTVVDKREVKLHGKSLLI